MAQRVKVLVDRDLADLIPTFLSNRSRDLENLRQALTTFDFDSMRVTGHNMKGVGSGYGFHKITEIGSQIESAAKGHDHQGLQTLIDAFDAYLAGVEVEFV